SRIKNKPESENHALLSFSTYMWKRSLFRSFFLNFTVLIILKAVAVQILELATAPLIIYPNSSFH
ncbi:MAG TPA: hypothetical protein DCY75_05725, partial [Clostridiales bacterium]|nr:hypothetical protein [Clostridiales bacterium]